MFDVPRERRDVVARVARELVRRVDEDELREPRRFEALLEPLSLSPSIVRGGAASEMAVVRCENSRRAKGL